jgi:hypothetical protein
MRARPNQKKKRKPRRILGHYLRNGMERYVALHPTKGFRDRGIERIAFGSGFRKKDAPVKSAETIKQDKIKAQRIASNAPSVRHNRNG